MENCINFPGYTGAASASAEACDLARTIADMIGAVPLPFHADQIDWYLKSGFTADLLLMAAESTMLAPRPSWAYFRAILRNCASDGCKTGSAYLDRLEDWKHWRQMSGRQVTGSQKIG